MKPGRLIVGALALAALTAGAAAGASARWPRLRHLAVPTLSDPSLEPAAERRSIEPREACAIEPLARLPGRVSALLETGDGLWAGGFDTGVFKLEMSEGRRVPRAVLGLVGRERFVNALAFYEGRVWAATYAGILEISPSGRIERRHLPQLAAESLLATDAGLLVGTSAGLFLLAGGQLAPVPVADRAGEPLRVTALAVAGKRLWLGTPSGAWSIDWPLPAYGLELDLRWSPLVFGERAARTNVVLSLVPWGESVLAGTDDGGLVLIGADGTRAVELDEPRANESNPGAAARLGELAVVGTQGAGLLFVSPGKGSLSVGRPRDWPHARVSAVAVGASLLVGDDGGEIVRVACP
jgi:hypothetical protein